MWTVTGIQGYQNRRYRGGEGNIENNLIKLIVAQAIMGYY